jgi:hypothetical protein
MKQYCVGLTLLLFVTGQAMAGQYAVQLEASRSPSLAKFQELSAYGRLYTETTEQGYIRKRMGPYENRIEALDVLKQVHAAGYKDAIITRQQGSSAASSHAVNTPNYAYDIEKFDVKTLKEWKLLTPEQQKNLVYLDGKLHIKSGDQFTPLNEVISGK